MVRTKQTARKSTGGMFHRTSGRIDFASPPAEKTPNIPNNDTNAVEDNADLITVINEPKTMSTTTTRGKGNGQ